MSKKTAEKTSSKSEVRTQIMLFSNKCVWEYWNIPADDRKNINWDLPRMELCKFLGKKLLAKLREKDLEPKAFYLMLHDQDNKPDGTPKDKHIHGLIYFSSKKTINTVSKALGFAENVLQKSHTIGRYALNNCMAYLIHAKEFQNGKHHYSPLDVYTVIGEPYTEWFDDNQIDIRKGLAVNKNAYYNSLYEELWDKIENRQITRTELISNPQSDYWKVYNRHSKKFDTLFLNVQETIIEELKKNGKAQRHITIWITGKSGKGKTALARAIAETRQESLYESTVKGALDNYVDERIILKDDEDYVYFSPKQFLQQEDPHRPLGKIADCRYKPKPLFNSMTIYTTTLDPLHFLYGVYSTRKIVDEDWDKSEQYLRRIDIIAEFDDSNENSFFDSTKNELSDVIVHQVVKLPKPIELEVRDGNGYGMGYRTNYYYTRQTTKRFSGSIAEFNKRFIEPLNDLTTYEMLDEFKTV